MARGDEQAGNIIASTPSMDEGVRELAAAKLEAVRDFYEARAKMARLNAELFDKGLVFNHELMSW